MISKEKFISSIKKIKEEMKYIDDMGSLMAQYKYDNYIMYPKTLGLAVDLLGEALNLTENEKDLFDTWAYEYDFGRNFEIGFVTITDKKEKTIEEPDLSSPEKYYDFIDRERKRKEKGKRV